MLEGDRSEAKKLFYQDRDDIFGPSSPHINILWALEVLAWDPKLLQRVGLVLAKLAEIDPEPDSNMVNRPINSLRSILLSWSPNTYANLKQRIACLDTIIKIAPDVGWDLLVKLLPRSHDTSSPTQKPKIRDVSPMEPEGLTHGLVWDSQAAIVSRAIRFAHDSESRVLVLLGKISNFHPRDQRGTLNLIDQFLTTHPLAEGSPVWHALREEIARHEYFSASDWSVSKEELVHFKEVLERHQPNDQVALERRLFDDWTPYVGQMRGENLDVVENARLAALQRIWSIEGASGIVRLVQMVKVPSLIGAPLEKLGLSEQEFLELLILSIQNKESVAELSFQLSAIGVLKYGDSWRDIFQKKIIGLCDSSREIARLLMGWPLTSETWAYVEALGSEVKEEYWARVNSLPDKGSTEELLVAINEFRNTERSLDVLVYLHHRIHEVPSDLLLALLDEAYVQLARNPAQKYGTMLSFYLNKVFDKLQASDEVLPEDLARREYVYLPILDRESRSLTLHKFMATNPAFYVEVLSHVFRGNNEQREENQSESDKARTRNSYDLLASFKTVPGQIDQHIDTLALKTWVQEVRALAGNQHRAEIADQYIGHVLAYAPIDPNTSCWPHEAVCAVLEDFASDAIERGIEIERHNMRGVYSKAIHEGGEQERSLANTYDNWARAVQEYPRTFAMLTRIAADWIKTAEQEDIRSEQSKLKE